MTLKREEETLRPLFQSKLKGRKIEWEVKTFKTGPSMVWDTQIRP